MDVYASHSKMTDPGQYGYLYDDLPDDIDALHHVVNNIFVHIWKMRKQEIPQSRKRDFAIRPVEQVLERVKNYDDSPLTVKRPREKQFIGDCRHAAVLLCSMLRHQGIPARVRHGFCQYISSNTENYTNHVITEYWNGEQWVLEDPDIIRHDIPRDEFYFGADVWQKFRASEINPDKFYHTEDLQGDWIFPLPLLRDLASLAKYETSSSDMWGIIKPYYRMTDAEKSMLDDAAAMFAQSKDVAEIYRKHPALKVSQPMFTWDWATDNMIVLDISKELD